jgi:hypothetical protein
LLLKNIRIVTNYHDLREGLFGQVVWYVFEILPYLDQRGLRPDWTIRAERYGATPDAVVIPGFLDIAYSIPSGTTKDVNLLHLRDIHRQTLGNDWRGLSALWHRYFRIPERMVRRADQLGSLETTLGVHYRGQDKQPWDSNWVNQDDYLPIIKDFLSKRPDLTRIFLATDEYSFYQYLKDNLSIEIVNFGDTGFFKAAETQGDKTKADRAMLDSYVLSRCAAVLQTSSALSAFAKILNPDLEIYRVAAAKFFINIPYFPTSFVPRYVSSSPEITTIVDRLMIDDWTTDRRASLYLAPFVSRREWSPIARRLFLMLYKSRHLSGVGWAVSTLPRWGAKLKLLLRGKRD